jgi:hypothetical protein
LNWRINALSQSLEVIIERFKDYLKTESAIDHLKKIEKEQEEVKELMDKLAARAQFVVVFVSLFVYLCAAYATIVLFVSHVLTTDKSALQMVQLIVYESQISVERAVKHTHPW